MAANAMAAAPPGHTLPDVDDYNTQQAVIAWVTSLGTSYISYGQTLVDEGYDSLYSMTFDADELAELCPEIKRGHAIRMARAAKVIAELLGVAEATATSTSVDGEVVVRTRGAPKDIPDLNALPTAIGRGGYTDADIGSKQDMEAWWAEL